MTSLQQLAEASVRNAESSPIESTYLAKTTRSASLHAKAVEYQPSGVSRLVGYWEPYPLTFARGEGCYVFDVDGNRYTDMLCNYTSLVHGLTYPPIQEAIERSIGNGTAWCGNNVAQYALAEQLVNRIASVDQVRFTNSGTEAGNLALLIARAVTGRYKVLMARHGYHGSLLEFASGSMDQPGPATLLARYGDADSFKAVLEEHGQDIAAVFVEGVMGAGGMQQAPAEFFIELKQAASKAGALLVIDEVITFRLGLGGQQGNLGVTADLTMLGKLIGGGFAVGAVGASRELMSVMDSRSLKIMHSGTFNANPMTMTAGDVSVRELTQVRIDTMSEQGLRVAAGLKTSAEKLGLPLTINQCGSLLNLFFSDDAQDNMFSRTDNEAVTLFHLACFNRGVSLAARGMIVLSTVMTSEVIDDAVSRMAAAMEDVAAEI